MQTHQPGPEFLPTRFALSYPPMTSAEEFPTITLTIVTNEPPQARSPLRAEPSAIMAIAEALSTMNDSRSLDAGYVPFPAFEEWRSRSQVDSVRWERYKSAVDSHQKLSGDTLDRSRQIATRAAALETGAIEGLYEVDRGFTYTVAFEIAAWEAALLAKGERLRSLFEAQLHAYDYVLDLVTKAQPLSEAAVRVLHQEVCRGQPTYRAFTTAGPQEQPLPKGQYKALPNHVHTRKGTDHSYSPVDLTPSEMERLMRELRSEEFNLAHPVLQAAYAHYGLVAIHPFTDGNGRVARALASAFTYRAISMPIIILSEHNGVAPSAETNG
jgi:Fic family protein